MTIYGIIQYMKYSLHKKNKSSLTAAVIDAQGAGIGKAIITELRKAFGSDIKIYALGTNETACSNMKSAGSSSTICGNNKIMRFLNTRHVDFLIGPMGVISSGGILGEITPELSRAVFEADCRKYIIPLDLHGVYIPGTRAMRISDSIEEIIRDIKNTHK